MRILLVVFIGLICFACSPKISSPYNSDQNNQINQNRSNNSNLTSKPVYDDWYDSFLEEGEQKKHSDYISIVSQNTEGVYIKRVFFPDTRTMTHYNEFMNKDLVVKSGEEKVWTDKGVLISVGQYIEGKEVGLFRNFDRKTGKLNSEGNYSAGKREGSWSHYYPDGELLSKTSYKKGMKEGKFSNYTEEGEQIVEIDYRADTIYNSKILKVVDSMLPLNKSEQMPMYGDGCPEEKNLTAQKECSQRKMLTTMYKNLRYPPKAREYGLEGMALVGFVVDENGKVTELEVIRGLSQEISDEVTRVVKLLDTWVPGMQDGKPVKVRYTLPFKFRLE